MSSTSENLIGSFVGLINTRIQRISLQQWEQLTIIHIFFQSYFKVKYKYSHEIQHQGNTNENDITAMKNIVKNEKIK